jgi:hypothetical protein
MLTKVDYRQYVRDFNRFFERNGVEHMSSAPVQCPDCDVDLDMGACPECGKDGMEISVEPYFSWRRCDCCGDHLGGNREDYVAYNVGKMDEMIPLSICEDCVYFNEYGTWPDMPMLEVDKDQPKCRLRDGRVGICIDLPNNATATVSTDTETLTVLWDDVILEGEDGW